MAPLAAGASAAIGPEPTSGSIPAVAAAPRRSVNLGLVAVIVAVLALALVGGIAVGLGTKHPKKLDTVAPPTDAPVTRSTAPPVTPAGSVSSPSTATTIAATSTTDPTTTTTAPPPGFLCPTDPGDPAVDGSIYIWQSGDVVMRLAPQASAPTLPQRLDNAEMVQLWPSTLRYVGPQSYVTVLIPGTTTRCAWASASNVVPNDSSAYGTPGPAPDSDCTTYAGVTTAVYVCPAESQFIVAPLAKLADSVTLPLVPNGATWKAEDGDLLYTVDNTSLTVTRNNSEVVLEHITKTGPTG